MSQMQIKKKFLAPEVIEYFDDQIDLVEQGLAQELIDRAAGDENLQGQISQEITDRQNAISSVESDLSVEISDRQTADAGLQSQISQEISDRQSAVSGLQSQISQEISDRTLAVQNLSSELSQEVSARQSGDAGLQSQITQEISDRQAGDNSTLASANSYTDLAIAPYELKVDAESKLILSQQYTDTKIAQEVIDRNAAITSAVAAEESARELADAGLQSQINTEKGRIDAILSASSADKDSFKEIVDLINSVDTENDSAFAGYVSSNNAAVSALEGRVTTLEGEMDSAEGRLTSLESGVSTLNSEVSALQAADLALDARIDALEVAKPTFDDEHILMSTQPSLTEVVLNKKIVKVMSAAIGRVAIHESVDFTVSTVMVGGVEKSKITFIGSLVAPGAEALTGDDWFHTVYAY